MSEQGPSPMSDHAELIERLRWFGTGKAVEEAAALIQQQTATIARKDAEIARLREALNAIRQLETQPVHVGYDNSSGGGNFLYAEHINAAEAYAFIDTALTKQEDS